MTNKNIRQVLFTVSVRWTAVDLFALTTQGHLRLPLPLWQTTPPSYAMTSEALLSHLPRTVMVCLRTWLIRPHCHRKKHENTCKTCWDAFVNIRILRHNDPYKPVYFHLVSLFSQTLKMYHKTQVTCMSTSFFILWPLEKKRMCCCFALWDVIGQGELVKKGENMSEKWWKSIVYCATLMVWQGGCRVALINGL